MVKIMENPIKIGDLGGKPTIFGNISPVVFPSRVVAAMSGGYDGSEPVTSREEWSALEVSCCDGWRQAIYIDIIETHSLVCTLYTYICICIYIYDI